MNRVGYFLSSPRDLKPEVETQEIYCLLLEARFASSVAGGKFGGKGIGRR